MDIKSILWATDGSDEAERALKYSTYIAKAFNSSIKGLHVIPLPVDLLLQSMRESDIDLEDWKNSVETNASNSMIALKDELLQDGIEFDWVILKGIPADKIVEYANKQKVDLIVIGKRGHSLIDSIFLGSTTIKVLQQSGVPVLAVKGDWEKKNHRLKKLLVPLDIAEEIDSSFLTALDIAPKLDAEIHVVYALRLDMYAQEIPAGALDSVIKLSQKELEKRVASLKQKSGLDKAAIDNVNITASVIHGLNPAASINNYATENNTDLTILNTHNRTGIKHFILGSVTERVIPYSPCSVLVLKPDTQP